MNAISRMTLPLPCFVLLASAVQHRVSADGRTGDDALNRGERAVTASFAFERVAFRTVSALVILAWALALIGAVWPSHAWMRIGVLPAAAGAAWLGVRLQRDIER